MKRIWILIPVLLLLVAGGYHAASSAIAAQGGDEKEKNRGAWLGVKLTSVEKIVDGKSEKTAGARVAEVIDDSPADSAGIEAGDIIIACGNVEIADAEDLVKAMRGSTPGEVTKITLLRDGEQKTVTARLGAAKQRMFRVQKRITRPHAMRVPRPPKMTWHQRTNYGFSLETLNPQLAEYFGAPEGKGVLIEKVREDSDAAKAGFQAGDVITRAGKKTVENVSDFKHVLGAYDAGENIPVQVLRKGKSMTIELEATEFDDEEHVIMKHFGHMGDGEFEWHGDDDEIIHLGGLAALKALKNLEHMDLDMNIDVDVEEMEDGLREMRIMLNGKELELKELQEELREHLQEIEERIRVEVEEGEDGEMEVRVRKI